MISHFRYSLSWYFFPLSKLLHLMGFSRTRAALVLMHAIHVRRV